MSRLIDADCLNFEGQHYNNSQMKAILDFIDAQPTAYDVDKVVEQLEELKAIKDGVIPIIHGQEELKLHDREIRNKAIDECIKILDTKEPKYHDVLNDRYDMIEYLMELKMELSNNWMDKEVDRNKTAYREGYNKAIDDFANTLKQKYSCLGYIDVLAESDIDEIAEQLKAGDVD